MILVTVTVQPIMMITVTLKRDVLLRMSESGARMSRLATRRPCRAGLPVGNSDERSHSSGRPCVCLAVPLANLSAQLFWRQQIDTIMKTMA